MRDLDPADVLRLCRVTGHGDVIVRPNRRGTGYVARCKCGYFSEARAVEAAAVSEGVEHLRRSARAAMRDFPGWGAESVFLELVARRYAAIPDTRTIVAPRTA